MMRRILSVLLFICITFSLSAAAESYLSAALGWSYDTNSFSSPYPVGYDPEDGYPNGGSYLKRHNIILSVDYDLYFSEGSRIGLSIGGIYAMPFAAIRITPVLSGGDIIHEESNALPDMLSSLFFSIGPVFRYSWDIFTISLPIRFSFGTYDWFISGIELGASLSPSFQIDITETISIRASLLYDAHFMKFLFNSSHVYDSGYIMLNIGASVGCVFDFGG